MKRLVRITHVAVVEIDREKLESEMSVDPITDSEEADELFFDYINGDVEATLDEFEFEVDKVEISRIEGEIDDLAEEPDEEEDEDEEEEDGK